jgi:putative tricarboxylic transport membrane protein
VPDAAAGLVLVALGLAYLGEASAMPLGTWEEPGPAAFPLLLGVSFVLGAGLVTVRGALRALAARRARGRAGTDERAPALAWSWGPALIVAVSIAGVLLMSNVGYLVGGFLLFGATMPVLGARRLWVVLAVAVLATLATDLLFRRWLGVPLP